MLPSHSPVNLSELDSQAFGDLAEPHRRELQAHCYRMLGCLQEAEDLVQETLWRAWNRRETYAGRGSFRAWLYTIATHACLDALRQRPRRSLPGARQAADRFDGPVPPPILEPIWLEPFPDDLLGPEEAEPEARFARRESISLAFMTSLHLLPPRQRAVLILRDVLDWQASEVAELMGQTVPSVKSALHRARSTLARHYTASPADEAGLPAASETLARQLERYVQAWEAADVEALLRLLKADATFSMPPTPAWYRGRDTIGRLVGATIFSGPARGRWRLRPTRASGQPGFGLYRVDDAGAGYNAYGIQVVSFEAGQIADLITFRMPALAPFFSLPATLPAG
jgi:RNA polymerase sigma-70 factor (ECF subfamily)